MFYITCCFFFSSFHNSTLSLSYFVLSSFVLLTWAFAWCCKGYNFLHFSFPWLAVLLGSLVLGSSSSCSSAFQFALCYNTLPSGANCMSYVCSLAFLHILNRSILQPGALNQVVINHYSRCIFLNWFSGAVECGAKFKWLTGKAFGLPYLSRYILYE